MWAEEDRPREKSLKHGFKALSDAELIAILIGSGNSKETAVELSRRILNGFGNDLMELGHASVDKLMEYKGIGEAKAINILAALELGRRQQLPSANKRAKIQSSLDIHQIMKPLLCDIQHEEFWVLFLDRSNNVIDKKCISQGGISSTIIDIRIIMKMGIEKLASALILTHNHPSGNISPSHEDISITKKCKEAGLLVDIAVIDHIIIGRESYYSFADEGLL